VGALWIGPISFLLPSKLVGAVKRVLEKKICVKEISLCFVAGDTYIKCNNKTSPFLLTSENSEILRNECRVFFFFAM
jgi:hypothetical protein